MTMPTRTWTTTPTTEYDNDDDMDDNIDRHKPESLLETRR